MSVRATCLTRLFSSVNADGSWGYRPGTRGCSEPTALACLALSVTKKHEQLCERGLQWLAQTQNANGAVPIVRGMTEPNWPTALAALAWNHAPDPARKHFKDHAASACEWLLAMAGERLDHMPDIYGHDTSLQGWSWAPATHSWVEPTAYSILALKSQGSSDQARVREGVRLLLDRASSEGGWNYGNPRILANHLRPFPATTGIALAALAGEETHEQIQKGTRYLLEHLKQTTSPLSLAWGLVGLTAWGKRPDDARQLLARSMHSAVRAGFGNMVDALATLALSHWTGNRMLDSAHQK